MHERRHLRSSGAWSGSSEQHRRVLDVAAVALVACAAFAVVVLRRPDTITHAELWGEDGGLWFANAHNLGPWVPLLQPHNGYLQTLPRLVADAGLLLPLRDLPLFFAVVAVVVQVLPAVIVVSRRFEPLAPSRPFRLLLAATYLAVPNSWEVDANLTNAQWHLALLALLCLLAVPGNPGWKVFDVVVAILSGLTGPFVIVLALVGAWWVWKGPRTSWRMGLWVASFALALVQGAELLLSPRVIASLGATPTRFVEILGGDVGLGALVGQDRLSSIVTGPHFLLYSAAGAVVFVVVVGWALVRAPLALKVLDAYAVIVLVSSLASPDVSSTGLQWRLITGDLGGRYWFFPTVAFLVSAVWLGCGSAHALISRRRRSGSDGAASHRRRGRAGVTAGLLLGSLVGVGTIAQSATGAIAQDWAYAPYARVGYYQAARAFADARPGAHVKIPEDPPGWSMTLVKR